MRITFKRESLYAALRAVAGALPRESPRPALECVHMEARGAKDVIVSATDLSVAVRCRVKAKKVKDGGAALVGGRLVGLLRETPEEDVKIQVEKGRAKVTAGRSTFHFVVAPVEEYPALPEFKQAACTIPGGTLATLVQRTVFATDRKGGRYATNAVSVKVGEGKAEFAATDGKRLAVAISEVAEEAKLEQCIVPPKMLAEIRRLAGEEKEVEMAIEGGSLLARSGDVVVAGTLVDGTFPAYRQMIPKPSSSVLEVGLAEFISRLRQAKELTTEESRSVVLTVEDGGLTVEARSAAVGEGSIPLEATYSGEKVVAAFNPQFLLGALQQLEQGEGKKVALEIAGSDKPAVLRRDDFIYVLAPVKVRAERAVEGATRRERGDA